MNRDDYLYAAGVIRHLETQLLNTTDVERMVDAPDLETAYKVFHDTDYFDNVLDLPARDFLKALDADLKQAKDNLSEILPDDLIIKLLFIRYDFHNLKLSLKARYSGQNLDQYASTLGLVEYGEVKRAVNEGLADDLVYYLKTALNAFNRRLNGTEPTPAQIDRYVDQEYFKAYHEAARHTKSVLIKDFVKLQADFNNIKIYIRSKTLGLSSEQWLEDIIPFGTLLKTEYEQIVPLSLEEAINILADNFSRDVSEVIKDFLTHKSLENLEKNLENLELDFLRQSRFIDYGPELPVAYYFSKKNAIRNVRLIMLSKLNNIPASLTKAAIRELY